MKFKFFAFLAFAIFLLDGPAWAGGDIARVNHIFAKIITANSDKCPKISENSKCDIAIWVIDSNRINAATYGKNIEINSAMIKLLTDDNELSFVISHEVAHAMMEHSIAGREKDVKNPKIRAQMEIDADNLGVLLMARAGFEPKSAISAQERVFRYGRGPINRFLGLFKIEANGPYLKQKDRINVLAKRANEVASEVRN